MNSVEGRPGWVAAYSSVNEAVARGHQIHSSVNKAVDWVRPPSRRSFNDE